MSTRSGAWATPASGTGTADIGDLVHPLTGSSHDFDPLLSRVGNSRFVLIGEASHGTHEFYRIRAEITKRLIEEKGFIAVAVEADWPDAYRVNRYVRGTGDDADATDALAGFVRFPQWMWRNADVLDFIGWLRAHNDALERRAPRVGFYGLDLYSMYASIEAVLSYLDSVDPSGARRARGRYACFDQFDEDPQRYGHAASSGYAHSCETEVIAQLVEMRRSAAVHAAHERSVPPDARFYAEQNARLVANAEAYYRAMFGSRVSSWNLRDGHMAETLDALDAHLAHDGGPPKIVVWAHNSHLGDARATELSRSGELNLGQLVRERYAHDAVLVGFSTYGGTVTAASDWDAAAERKIVRPALPGSYESLFHEMGGPNFMVDLAAGSETTLRHPKLQRAIGVIYRPETERQSHYYHASLRRQFDALLHYDQTRAVEPLESTALWTRGEAPETFPSAL
jgi:erythromycin esterase-like protein